MYRKRLLLLFFALGMLVAVPQLCAETLLYESLDSGNYQSVSYANWQAQQFMTDGNSYSLSSVWLNLWVSSLHPDTPSVYIYDTDGGKPNEEIGSLITPAITQDTRKDYRFLPVGNIQLDPWTQYWVVANAPTGWVGWSYTDIPDTGVWSGVGFMLSSTTGADGTNWNAPLTEEPYMMEVNALAGGEGVPEPATFLMIAPLGLLALYLRRRRANSTASADLR